MRCHRMHSLRPHRTPGSTNPPATAHIETSLGSQRDTIIFAARRYAGAVVAVVACPSVRHKPMLQYRIG